MMKEKIIKLEDVVNLITFLNTCEDNTFNNFMKLYDYDSQYVDTLKRHLVRKNIIRCSRCHDLNGKFYSKKEVLISDIETIKKILSF